MSETKTEKLMKILTKFLCMAFAAALMAAPVIASAAAGCAGCSGAASLADKAAAARPYPLPTCIVTDEKLGEMGEPFVFVYQGQEIKLCCKSCKKKFDKAPETYLQKLAQAPAAK
jgi:YHS domain-containing protein